MPRMCVRDSACQGARSTGPALLDAVFVFVAGGFLARRDFQQSSVVGVLRAGGVPVEQPVDGAADMVLAQSAVVAQQGSLVALVALVHLPVFVALAAVVFGGGLPGPGSLGSPPTHGHPQLAAGSNLGTAPLYLDAHERTRTALSGPGPRVGASWPGDSRPRDQPEAATGCSASSSSFRVRSCWAPVRPHPPGSKATQITDMVATTRRYTTIASDVW